MALKDLVDALDGFVGDDADLASQLKRKSTQDLRAVILQEKYANKIPSQNNAMGTQNDGEFLIEGLPESGRTAPQKRPLTKKEKTAADILLETMTSVQKPVNKERLAPVDEEPDVSPKLPRQSRRISRDVDVDVVVESLKESLVGEEPPAASENVNFLEKMLSTGKLGGNLADAVPYSGDGGDEFVPSRKSSGSGFLGKMMSTGKLGGTVDSSQLEKPPIIEDVDMGDTPVQTVGPVSLDIDPTTGMPRSLKRDKKTTFDMTESLAQETPIEDFPQETAEHIEPADEPVMAQNDVIVLPAPQEEKNEEKTCVRFAYLSRSHVKS
jgi:hypothetical protein